MNRAWRPAAVGLVVRGIATVIILIGAAYGWLFIDAEPGLKSDSLPASVAIISFGLAGLCASIELKIDARTKISQHFLYVSLGCILFSPFLNKYRGLPDSLSIYVLALFFISSLTVFFLAMRGR
jgi:hypothetical protein